MLKTARQAATLRQLEDVEQQITHLVCLLEQDGECLEVVRHTQAVRHALGTVGLALLDDCLRAGAAAAVNCQDPACRERQIALLDELYAAVQRWFCPTCRQEWQTPGRSADIDWAVPPNS